MTLTINHSNYLKLLNEMQLIPKVIETEAEYEQNLAVVEQLIAKKISVLLKKLPCSVC
ncbi:MAG: hypothetical protein AAF298_01275 [Cyanobacteria bacterium P01_A01_bin.40]